VTGIERGLALVLEGIETEDQVLITRGFDRFNNAVASTMALLTGKKN